MKKITLYLLALMLTSVAFTACDDQFAGQFVADPTVNEQGELQSANGFTFAIGSGVASAVVLTEEDIANSKMFEVIRTTAMPQVAENAVVNFRIELSDTEDFANIVQIPSVSENNAASIMADDLNATVKSLFGVTPVARELFMRATPFLIAGGTQALIAARPVFEITVTPISPVIETEYYLIGDINGWDIEDLANHQFSHSGRNVYEDPIFTILVENLQGYFKIVPKSSKDLASWDGVLGNLVDGNTDLTGTLVVDGGAMQVTEPGWVRVTLNMLEYTYTIEIIGEMNLTLWVPGSHQGWNPATAPTLFARNFDFKYEGYVNFSAGDEFKFTAQPDWGPVEYGDGGDGTLVTSGGGNISITDAGFYRITVDLSGNPYTYLLEKTDWGLIGDATGSWDNSTPMTFDPATSLWTVTTALSVGEFKFRANDSWNINLGGDLLNLSYGGDNIAVTEAGTYLVTLDLSNSMTYKASFVKQ
ncbi:MAG: SusF/SusE family outer membrane protein [Dysgonamonadaceae bacterium]|jgi:hypothetical protein|nr:SusF/SusE family outer membrane protein [Dysgonamonadaceae bacterium]